MTGQAPQYRSANPNVDAFDEDTAGRGVAPYKSRRTARTDFDPENSVPLFLSDSDGEPDPSEYINPLLRKRKASILSGVLTGVCAAAAVAILVALLSSDATQDIGVNVRASMAAAFPTPSVAAPSDSSQVAAPERQNDAPRPSVPENSTSTGSVTTGASVAMAATEPARAEVKMAYQSALQDRAPAVDATTPADTIHHLDPDVIAALLRRADALIASGDVAAARLVLRRAADAGEASAAMKLAETYDPANLAKLGVHGIVPDVSMARSWYEKARQFGSVAAPQRLETLAGKQQ